MGDVVDIRMLLVNTDLINAEPVFDDTYFIDGKDELARGHLKAHLEDVKMDFEMMARKIMFIERLIDEL